MTNIMGRPLALGTLLAAVTLTAHAQIDSAPVAAVPPNAAHISPEWLRLRDALRKAKPMPDPAGANSSPTPTPSGNMRRFDALTKKFTEVAVTPELLTAPPQREPQFLGALPTKTVRSLFGESALPAFSAGRSVPQALADGVNPETTTPTPPVPYEHPYSFPFNTVFRLLMRFTVSGFADQYYLCSASAASDHYLLSAAHCVYNHDPLDDGSGRGAGFAAEIWAWPAETDVVEPLDPTNWPDFPYGVVKMTAETTYNAWINSSDLNWDFSFISVDRRIGDHVGWMGTEWGTTTASLNFDGYPAEAPYVPSDNPYQYFGFDANNVIAYTCCRIQMDAYTYGGHSGGPVWRYDGTNHHLEGVNSTSNRSGYAEATLFTAQTHTDLTSAISASAPPTDLAQLIEYVFNGTSKGLLTTQVAVGHSFGVTLNAFNAGYSAAGDTTAYLYLTPDESSVADGTYVGSVDLGYLDVYQYTVQSEYITIPSYMAPGNYFVGWVLGGANPQYGTDKNEAIITDQVLQVIALSGVSATPSSLTGGESTTGTLTLTGAAPSPGVDVALSSSQSAAVLPISVHVNTGASSATFAIKTNPVAAATTAVITANGSGVIATTPLTVKPPVLKSLVAVKTVVGGDKASATVTLNGAAPAGGAKVALSSSKSQAIVPGSVTVPAGSYSAPFTISTTPVSANVTAGIKAGFGGVGAASNLVIEPLQLIAVNVAPGTILGGAVATATVALNGAVPSGSVTATLSSSSGKATVPKTVAIKAGLSSITFSVTTSAVTAPTSAVITVTLGGTSKTATLTLDPVQPKSVTLSPSSVHGGTTSTATVTINGAAGAAGAKLTLSSSKSSATVPASVTIAAGAKTGTFKIATTSVTANTAVTIEAASGSYSASSTLTELP